MSAIQKMYFLFSAKGKYCAFLVFCCPTVLGEIRMLKHCLMNELDVNQLTLLTVNC